MIGFTTLGTNDLQRAMAFYDALFASVGISRLLELPELAAWGVSWERPMFGIARPQNGAPAEPGNGTVIAMGQRTREKVHRLYSKALELGGSDGCAPSLRGPDDSQGFYAAYVRDLDGNKLCFYCVGPAD